MVLSFLRALRAACNVFALVSVPRVQHAHIKPAARRASREETDASCVPLRCTPVHWPCVAACPSVLDALRRAPDRLDAASYGVRNFPRARVYRGAAQSMEPRLLQCSAGSG